MWNVRTAPRLRCLRALTVCVALVGLPGCGSPASPAAQPEHTPTTEVEAAPPADDVFFAGGAQRPGDGENPIVLEWSVDMTNFRSTGDELRVRRDRSATHVRVADRAENAFERSGTIPSGAWEGALQALREHHVCALRSTREPEHEEPSGILAVDAGGLRCRVLMPEGDWGRAGDARAVRDVIEGLMAALPPAAP